MFKRLFNFLKVHLQSIKLLADFTFRQQQRHLLLQPLRIDLHGHLSKPLLQTLTVRGADLGQHCLKGADGVRGGTDTLLKHLCECKTFPFPRIRQLPQRCLQQIRSLHGERLLIHHGCRHHTRPFQHLTDPQWLRLGHDAAHTLRPGSQFTDQTGVHSGRV